ncbi:MAG: hypothetical protein ACLGI6_06730 [Gammaproteobacteria bacterium]
MRFDSRAAFQQHFLELVKRSRTLLQLFDPDYAVLPLGSSEVDAALREFLGRGGVIELAAHRNPHIEREYPRFLRLLKDYHHHMQCRLTPRNLQQLTDSFVIGDGVHIVRRFHCDHMRGEAAFDSPASTEISRERFSQIWRETLPGLAPSVTGL